MIAASPSQRLCRSNKETPAVKPRRVITRLALTLSLAFPAILALATSVSAATPAPHWQIIVQPAPTYFHAGDSTDFYEVVAVNDGGAPTTGQITLIDTLPEGLLVTSASSAADTQSFARFTSEGMSCTVAGADPQTVECTTEGSLPIGSPLGAKIDVEVPPGATGPLHNSATIGGGGAATAATTTNSTPVVDPSTPVPYGATLAAELTEEDGELATRAGSHPSSFSTILATHVGEVYPQEECSSVGGGERTPGCAEIGGTPRDIHVELPPGLIGNPLDMPRCSQEQFQAGGNTGCPASTQVGSAFLGFYSHGTAEQYAPVYNVEPPPGQPAEFGFSVGGAAHIPIFFHLRADGDYGLTVDLGNVTSFDAVRLAALTIWGVPAAAAHDFMRESSLQSECEPGESGHLGCPAGVTPTPLLSMPTSCSSAPLAIPLLTDSWQQPGDFASGEPEASIEPMGQCNRLDFTPTLTARPTTSAADSPSGLHVDLHVPQPESVGGLAEANLRNAVVTLPKGISVNPSSANGLEGCSPAQIELHGADPARCPDAAKIGTVEVDSPLVDHPLPGAVYLASPYAKSLRLAPRHLHRRQTTPKAAWSIKLAGEVERGPESGQLTTTFSRKPPAPLRRLQARLLHRRHSAAAHPRALRHIPHHHRTDTVVGARIGPPATPSDTFQITQAPERRRLCATRSC